MGSMMMKTRSDGIEGGFVMGLGSAGVRDRGYQRTSFQDPRADGVLRLPYA
jgi:hypothetical protein